MSPASRAKSYTLTFSSIRCGDVALGSGTNHFCRDQRISTCAGLLPCCNDPVSNVQGSLQIAVPCRQCCTQSHFGSLFPFRPRYPEPGASMPARQSPSTGSTIQSNAVGTMGEAAHKYQHCSVRTVTLRSCLASIWFTAGFSNPASTISLMCFSELDIITKHGKLIGHPNAQVRHPNGAYEATFLGLQQSLVLGEPHFTPTMRGVDEKKVIVICILKLTRLQTWRVERRLAKAELLDRFLEAP